MTTTLNGLAFAILVADTGAVARMCEIESGERVTGQRVILSAPTREALMVARKRVVAFLREALPAGFSYDEHKTPRGWVRTWQLQDATAHWETAMYW